MAVFVIDGKKYDTNKMSMIAHVKKWCKNDLASLMAGRELGGYCDCKLYRSEKGNYLLVKDECGRLLGEAIDETEAKQLLMCYDYKAYEKIYGEIEEA